MFKKIFTQIRSYQKSSNPEQKKFLEYDILGNRRPDVRNNLLGAYDHHIPFFLLPGHTIEAYRAVDADIRKRMLDWSDEKWEAYCKYQDEQLKATIHPELQRLSENLNNLETKS